jgi:hypothetical protein
MNEEQWQPCNRAPKPPLATIAESARSVAWVLALAAVLPTGVSGQVRPSGSELQLTAAVVLDRVEVKPLPLLDILLIPESGDTIRLATALNGTAHVDLPSGRYRLETPAPPTVRGLRYRWSLSLTQTAGRLQQLELTNANAAVDSVTGVDISTGAATAEAAVYARTFPSR